MSGRTRRHSGSDRVFSSSAIPTSPANPGGRWLSPFLEDAARQTQETCNIAILSDAEIVYVARVIAKRIISTNLSVGSRLPAQVTALGRVLLAGLPSGAQGIGKANQAGEADQSHNR